MYNTHAAIQSYVAQIRGYGILCLICFSVFLINKYYVVLLNFSIFQFSNTPTSKPNPNMVVSVLSVEVKLTAKPPTHHV